MFTDGRSKRVVFVAHCLLNQNAISDNTAVYPAAFREVVDFFLEQDVGIVQMPCPELCCLGLNRGDPAGGTREVTVENTRIRTAMQATAPHEMLLRLVELVMLQITEYHRNGFQILGIVGANRSRTAVWRPHRRIIKSSLVKACLWKNWNGGWCLRAFHCQWLA